MLIIKIYTDIYFVWKNKTVSPPPFPAMVFLSGGALKSGGTLPMPPPLAPQISAPPDCTPTFSHQSHPHTHTKKHSGFRWGGICLSGGHVPPPLKNVPPPTLLPPLKNTMFPARKKFLGHG